MSKRALVLCAAILGGVILTPRPASAWWETQVVTNKWEYDGVEYLQGSAQGPVAGAYIYVPDVHINGLDTVFYSAVAPSNFDKTQTQCLWCSRGDDTSTDTLTAFFLANTGLRLDYKDGSQFYQTHFIPTIGTPFTVMFIGGKQYINGALYNTFSDSNFTTKYGIELFGSYTGSTMGQSNMSNFRVKEFYVRGRNNIHLVPVLHDGEGKMLDLVHNTLYANAGTNAFSYGSVTGKVVTAFDRIITTNRVYHANPPQTAYDAASPWNAAERTRIGGDDTTLRPSAIIKED